MIKKNILLWPKFLTENLQESVIYSPHSNKIHNFIAVDITDCKFVGRIISTRACLWNTSEASFFNSATNLNLLRLRKSYSSNQSCWREKIFYKFQHVSSLGFRKRNSSIIKKLGTYHVKSKCWQHWATSVFSSSCILNLKGLLSRSINTFIKISEDTSVILECITLLDNGIFAASLRCCFLLMISTIWRAQGLMNVSPMVWALSFLTIK